MTTNKIPRDDINPHKSEYIKCQKCDKVIVILSKSHPPILMDFPPTFVPNKTITINKDDVTVLDDVVKDEDLEKIIQGFLAKHKKEGCKK